jgi:putative ABC transport system permease protein
MEIHRDVLKALRFAWKRRSFSALVILCMALGIGVNSAIFSVVDTALLRPLPYEDADRLAIFLDVHSGPGEEPQETNASPPNFLAWREQSKSFSQIEAMTPGFFNLTVNGQPERVKGASVTHGLLPMLGAAPVLGRTILPEEDRPGGAKSVLLSHDFWRSRFASAPEVLERPLTLNGEIHTVVGVMKPGFQFLEDVDLWVPLAMDPADPPFATSHYLYVSGRLQPGTSFEQARQEMAAIASRLAAERPDTNTGWTVKVNPLREQLVGDLRRPLMVLLAAVGSVLLIACANVSNLLLTRSIEQSGELAIRSALGASRRFLVRQMMVESVVLSLLGGLVGLALAWVTLRVLPQLAPSDVALLRHLEIDGRVLGFTFLISLLAGLLPVLVPALRASRPELQSMLKAGSKRASGGPQSRRILDGLVVIEIALAIYLLIGAGLMIKSFNRLYATDPGFDPESVLTMEVSVPEWKYTEPDQLISFWRNALAEIRTIPGVVAAGAAHALPVTEFAWTTPFIVESRMPTTAGETEVANFRRVTPDFFRAMGIPLVQGRLFTEEDDESRSAVVIVSQEMARRYWPGANPIGQRIQRVRNVPDNPWLTVVGVVGDVQDAGLGTAPEVTFYTPFPQNTFPNMHLVVRTSVEPLSLVSSVRQAIQRVDKDQPVAEVTTMDEWIANSVSKRRFSTFMLSLFAGLGLVLAIVGIYGVLSYSVSQRRQEMGVRLALGADGRNLILLVLRHGLTLTAAGLALGIAAALLLTRLIAGLLFDVQPTDPVTFAGITAVLLLVGLAASYVPARRASRVDPIVSLKYE